jgi:hypothetical protein
MNDFFGKSQVSGEESVDFVAAKAKIEDLPY